PVSPSGAGSSSPYPPASRSRARRPGKHQETKRNLAYTGLVTCGLCRCSIMAEMKKGRYVLLADAVSEERRASASEAAEGVDGCDLRSRGAPVRQGPRACSGPFVQARRYAGLSMEWQLHDARWRVTTSRRDRRRG